MKNCFTPDIYSKIESEHVIAAFRRADEKLDKHIRVVIDENNMKLSIYGEDLEIIQAILFAWTDNGIDSMNFIPEDDERSLYAAIFPSEYMAVCQQGTDYPMEGIWSYGTKDVFFIIFETEDEIIYLCFNGLGTHLARSQSKKADSSPNVMDAIHAIFDTPQQDDEE